MKVDDLDRLERTERMMVRWMCGVSLKNRRSSVDLYKSLGIENVAEVVRRGRLRWFGHVERKDKDEWVSARRYLCVDALDRDVEEKRSGTSVSTRTLEV